MPAEQVGRLAPGALSKRESGGGAGVSEGDGRKEVARRGVGMDPSTPVTKKKRRKGVGPGKERGGGERMFAVSNQPRCRKKVAGEGTQKSKWGYGGGT